MHDLKSGSAPDLKLDTFLHTVSVIPSIKVFPAVNGYNKVETIQELSKTSLRFFNLYSPKHSKYGVLANFLSKYNLLMHQIENEIPYMCFIEDDVFVKKYFKEFVRSKIKFFRKDKKLNIIRFGEWGEAYITSLHGARNIVKLIRANGIINNIDNQLRKNSGREKYIKCPFKLVSETNFGDCLSTSFIGPSFMSNQPWLKSKMHDKIKSLPKKSRLGNTFFFSQNGVDKYLLDNIFHYRSNGKFIDCGASNGINSNITFSFELCFNWSGILIEPSFAYEHCLSNRSPKNHFSRSVLSSASGTKVRYNHHKLGCFSGDSKIADIKDRQNENHWIFKARTKTLTSLINSSGYSSDVIDLMCVNANGHEQHIISGCDFKLFNIMCILVCCQKNQCFPVLDQNNFVKAKRLGKYDLYLNAKSFDYYNIDLAELPAWKNLW